MDIIAFFSNLSNLIILLTTVLIASVILIVILASTRTSSEGMREELSLISTADVEEERPPTSAPLSNISLDLMRKLDEFELINFNNLLEELDISRDELGKVLNDLVSQKYVEVSGDLVMLTGKGRKMLWLMREKRQR